VDRDDGLVGELDALVLRRDRVVVPVGDVTGEDAGDGRAVEVQRVDAVEVEGDGDGRDVDRDLDDLVVGAGAEAAGGDLVGVVRAVGPDEVRGAGDEVLAARAGAGGRVVDRGASVGGLESGDPGLLSGLLGRGAGGLDGARDGRLRSGGVVAGGGIALVRGTTGESESGDGAPGAAARASGDLNSGIRSIVDG
jgi:hypothetical protein